MQTAPYFEDVTPGCIAPRALWVTASDGAHLRLGVWNVTGARGTVLLFPGRTEYIEKYAQTATDFANNGLATIAIDWRGQGLADRLISDRRLGHVARFSNYQLDVAALVKTARALSLPQPYYLLAHSMGGAIGLRALHEGLPVAATAFSAPMWGIKLSVPMRPVAWALSSTLSAFGAGAMIAPGTKAENYVFTDPFEDNTLTTSAETFALMQNQMSKHPELALGGPTLQWLIEALRECRKLHHMESPETHCLTVLGTNERIVDVPRIHNRMKRWPNGRLALVEGAEHEMLMENPAIREPVFAQIIAHFGPHIRS